jgi:UDP-N-acetylmuramoyl-L-alanyl-D-glutamate--2,6-diaminopimelate ligase
VIAEKVIKIVMEKFKKLKLKRRGITLLAKMHVFGNPSKKMKVVGVTGTNGKTTTATLLYRVAKALGYKAGLIGTVESMIDDERRPATHTTPDPISLNKLLKEMHERGCEYVFMEVSSHAMDQDRVAGITFSGGVFTNLTHDHLDYHKNFENYFQAKKKFFQMLPGNSFALSNTDNEYGAKMTEGIKARAFFYGFDHGRNEDYHGEVIKSDFSGLELKFNHTRIKSALLGKFNAYNLLGVYSACDLLGFDMEKVKSILEQIKPPRGRFEHFTTTKGVLVIIDYAHTPDALENVLLTTKEIKPHHGKLISIFGCGGDRDPMKRPVMGLIGTQLSDVAIFTSDNPRSEDPEKIIEEMKKELSPELIAKVKTISNRREAIAEALNIAVKDDVILCAGKGHEDYQEIKGVKHHFDDREEFEHALQQK